MSDRLSHSEIADFQTFVLGYLGHERPEMPWRVRPYPYHVLVSEIMLQQTQVARVIPKFQEFITRFPDVETLAKAPLGDVLTVWSGLGYNRRAKFLWEAARAIVKDHGGVVPSAHEALVKLPGIGPNTAGAVRAYAFGRPSVFIETNVRTVFLHHFYADNPSTVHDKELYELVDVTLYREDPRQWYWALMDYGAYLKQTAGGRLSQSAHYRKQSPLAGSRREMRGRIMRALTKGSLTEGELQVIVMADDRFQAALAALASEGLIEKPAKQWRLTATSDDR